MNLWKKICPACGKNPREPYFDCKSSKTDFNCAHCRTQLTVNTGVPILLTLACAFPCILVSFQYMPTFTFIIGDGIIAFAFGFCFWPLRSIVVNKKKAVMHP